MVLGGTRPLHAGYRVGTQSHGKSRSRRLACKAEARASDAHTCAFTRAANPPQLLSPLKDEEQSDTVTLKQLKSHLSNVLHR